MVFTARRYATDAPAFESADARAAAAEMFSSTRLCHVPLMPFFRYNAAQRCLPTVRQRGLRRYSAQPAGVGYKGEVPSPRAGRKCA